ncbi:MAG: LL-diaminopimelate aminotransferase [Deltaproteobacteria bacterium]|nr:MAG: LL-diaminopimelate aminotransferase [Deltaproteobacteria bacterium]
MTKSNKTKPEIARRIRELPEYLFAGIDRKKAEALAKGVVLIDLSIGDPDQPTPSNIIRAMKLAVEDPANHGYPPYEGTNSFREAVATWYKTRFGIELDPVKEVLVLTGSKEGIAHIPMSFLNPGDLSLVPDPGYPVYNVGTRLAGGGSYYLPLSRENGFLPDLEKIPARAAKRAKLLFLNYPNNPTAAVAGKEFFGEAVKFAEKYRILICHDAAYSEVYYDDYLPPSFLEVEGAKEVGVEFHSLSKTFNMTGWRIGFVVGNAEAISALGKLKTNIDSGLFSAVQVAGIEALNGDRTVMEKIRAVYQERREVLVKGLKEAGLEIDPPKATFYLWIKVPSGYTSVGFVEHLLEAGGIVCTPGSGFGLAGEGYIRMALTKDKDRLNEAVARIKKIGF